MDTPLSASITLPSPWGNLLVKATDRGISQLEFQPSQWLVESEIDRSFPIWFPDLPCWSEKISAYLCGQSTRLDVPLDLEGTPFQLAVWSHLQSIPPGSTTSYSSLAAKIGRPGAVRAVASACARNRVAILIPCHRVIRSNGDLAGYRWGVDRKRALLDHEQRISTGSAEI